MQFWLIASRAAKAAVLVVSQVALTAELLVFAARGSGESGHILQHK